MNRAFVPLLAVITSWSMSTAALADQAFGWANWEAKAAAILAALQEPGHGEGKRQHVKQACSGITGTVIGQGFQFPYWAQQLIPMCREIDDIVGSDKEVSHRYWALQCKELKRYSGQLGKATPVAVAPTAHDKALALSAFMANYYEQECAHGLERVRH